MSHYVLHEDGDDMKGDEGMRYYVLHEDGDIWGPMSKEDAENMRNQLEDAYIFDETVFDLKIVEGVIENRILSFSSIPRGVEIHIKDYDIDRINEDQLKRDEFGRLYVPKVYTR